MNWRSYVAVGDSFTEGMDDPYPEGGLYRGWADLVATRLAAEVGPDFRYANLAIRGRLFPGVVSEQVPVALAMRPDLISFAAGGNDVLRRNFDPVVLIERFDNVVSGLRETGADVILFRFAGSGLAKLPGQRIVAPRVEMLNQAVADTAERRGARLVDLNADEEFRNPLLWSVDRLHLSALGHRRVAAHVLNVLGVGCDEEWLLVPPRPEPSPWLAARAADLRWAGRYLAPWVKRRITGRSSGDLVTAKRPTLAPIEPS
ncbi:SGNH/GDSL hydrolase family protein [Phytohabitans suffuscus]|uniref:SGNH/GDSL hydrolase family protein n=1 Tax=Phytohabitans suffuscus TaxID=624315 RepID=UPI0015647E96|nr:SGNH/GDSL hydrolase family protein [Phytohabitans suffuscus]